MRSLLVALVLLTPSVAFAYVGPGAGISAFGSVLALLAAAALAVVGFVWYPVKRLVRARRSKLGATAKATGAREAK